MSGNNALAGKAAFVTGGAGAIGSNCARLLARDGAAVLIMGRRKEALEESKAEILKTVPDARIEIHAGDACEEKDVRAALEQAHKMLGRLDIIVPTVGGGGFKPLLMLTAAELEAELKYNIVSAFLAVRYGVPLMEGKGGSIVCISSTAAKLPFAYLSAYHTSKGGLENFIRAAAEELGSAGVRINAVRPGLTRSGGTVRMIETPEVVQRFITEFPLGRAGEPEDIAEAVRYLAGPESSWVTGQSFAVDGGNEIRKNPDLSDMVAAMIGQDKLDMLKRGLSPE
ncbi:MAG TPA: SDR family oxidoreductase [Alphaproteobacteria bacterium]|jgi:NAD(P)-dependent dehydrogenase (short-subunit alcohol dehydrogenase family)|nr:SDR family oxidoreductase [Alphaproteobacteria bacterium]